MRAELRAVGTDVGRLQHRRGVREYYAYLLLKGVLIIGASSVVGVAQFMARPANEPLGNWGVAGVIVAVVIGIAGIVSIIRETIAPDELEQARRALAIAKVYDELAQNLGFLLKQNDRGAELFRSMELMRQSIQIAHEFDLNDEQGRIELLMSVSDPTLFLVFDFAFGERWSLSVYKAEDDPDCCQALVCRATKRSIKPSKGATRRWPVGVGFAGIALARGRELVISDLADKALGSLNNLPEGLERPEDADRYRSVAAVPIIVGDGVWGVAVATSDQAGRFHDEEEGGVRNVEAVRALAGMVGLAVATLPKGAEGGGHPSAPPPPPAPPSGRGGGRQRAREMSRAPGNISPAASGKGRRPNPLSELARSGLTVAQRAVNGVEKVR